MNFKEKIFEGLKKYYDEENLLYHVTEPENGAPSMIAMIHEDMSEMGNDATAVLFFIAGLDDEPVSAPEDPDGYLENAPVLHMFNIILRFGDVASPERMRDLSMAFAHLNNYTPGGLFVLNIKDGSFGYKQTLFLNESSSVDETIDNIDSMHTLAFMTCEKFMDKILDLADERISLKDFIKWSDSELTPIY